MFSFSIKKLKDDDKIFAEGDKVSFTIEKKPKGLRAFNIRKEAA